MTKQTLKPSSIAFLPMQDLFEQLRRAGLGLTIEQYELLRQALDAGFGLESWADLREVCRVLWVKPGLGDGVDVFERVFDEYELTYRKQV